MSESRGRRLPAGWRVVFHEVVGSTNDVAMDLARAAEPEGAVVWAARQDSGRGRNGRSWVSEAGNLYCSILIRPRCRPPVAATLGFVAALAVAETVSAYAPREEVRIKWPNDVLIGGAKVAGILIEADLDIAGIVDALVIGIGINVAHAPPSSATRYPTTSLRARMGDAGPEPVEVLERLCESLGNLLDLWRREGFGPVRDLWLARARGLGESIAIATGDDVVNGVFEGLDDDGALVLRCKDGARRISAGDVLFGGAI